MDGILPVTYLHSRYQGLCLESIARRYATARRLGKTLAAQAVLVILRSTRSLELGQGQCQADFFSTQVIGASRHGGQSTHRNGLLRG